ncbi:MULTISPECIES: gamma-glutamyl-gamma-aminobutyrate hydrolase family protein [Legionella]|uniref:Gamma-glutamyl-gamma-aminobutyrate hydrolase family protein n=1 Tax=Legionella resiliens TaxID=2905958 RepID=A0ABS8X4T2_9GAMM|nr:MULTISPECIES: gamma-glutamyl-gamma-aminobutyrate hydrolase family protein [unclassified Legionella]MCE0723817.1 gamma-glutamyl-gamma-aminobutyrate hydrolase family protein [Legionella sp. 9fVS26]MCE3532969.1 gamma-glutamyl-gamma-aminobutyrate hydrolase family protein [Legionella sp. 8cVS16]QLZ69160.1 hypothetical protein FOLKNPGA_01942 [Legionella sp. PC1000]
MFQKFTDYLFNSNNTKSNTSDEKPKFEYALKKDEKKQLKSSEEKPKIIALYDKSGGTTYCDLTINYLESKGIEVTPVTPEEGLNHPAFNGKFNGIYLPGGPNIPVDDPSDPRKKFEGQLTELAHTQDIPLLGICRGEQTIGHHHGHPVKDIPETTDQHEVHYEYFDTVYRETQDPTYNSKVVVGKGSQLYNALHHKLNYKEGSGGIEYNVTCLHHQHVEEHPENSDLQVSGRGKFDSLIESVEKRTGKYYTIGLQHHPEAVISSCAETRKEKISRIKSEAEEARFNANFFDPDVAIHTELTYSQRVREAHIKSNDEKAARAELGFFSTQVRQHHLERLVKKEDTENTRDSYFLSDPWGY